MGGPYLTGDCPEVRGSRSGGNNPSRLGKGRAKTRGGTRGIGKARGRVCNVDILLSDVGIPLISDKTCKTCDMGYEDDQSDITHCGKCRRKLHNSCYIGDGCRNCNYDPNM